MEKRKSKKLKFALSVLALVEVVALAVGITFSWMEGGKRGKIEEEGITISSSSNLTMFYKDEITNDITLDPCKLEEVSSKDGRNFFFPMLDTESNQTANMTFREGTAADRNKRYISVDFDLKAGDTTAKVFLGSGTLLSSNNSKVLNALRMSFSLNDGSEPIVFKPNQMPGISGVTFKPVISVSDGGKAVQGTQTTKGYGDYYYKGASSTPIFTVDAKQTKHITLNIWLEGTEIDSDVVAEQDLKIYIDFTTSVDDLKKYNFVDNTHGVDDPIPEYWITNKDNYQGQSYPTMMYVYDKTSDRYYAMNKSANYSTDHTWTAYVPDTITDFTFRRYCVDIDNWWNEWVPSMTIPADSNGNHTYVAICGKSGVYSGSGLTPCGGYWKDSKGTFRVYFQDNVGWGNVYCYAWNAAGKASSATGAHPGKKMTYSHKNEGNNVYYIDLYESDNLTGIQFNKDKSTDSRYQYEFDGADAKKYLFNGLVVWYNSSSSNGKYLYQGSVNSLIFN